MTALYGDGSSVSSYTPTLREKGVDWLARNWYGDTREGVDKAYKLSNVLETVTPYGMATMGYDAGRALGGGQPVQGAMMAGLAMAPLPAAAEKKAAQGIRAFHGSPHSFDRFSLDKIGTGEGAQVYGHGLYFADNESVAKSYRDTLSNADPSRFTTENAKQIAEGSLQAFSNDLPGALADLEDSLSITKRRVSLMGPDAKDSARLQDLQEAINYLKEGPSGGSMYEVNIRANPDDFLDWDKPLSEQPEISSKLNNVVRLTQGERERMPIRSILEMAGGADATPKMNAAGIPGIKYLDAGSRGTSGGEILGIVPDGNSYRAKIKKFGGGAIGSAPTDMVTTSKPFASEQEARKWAEGQIATGTRNYVVFDEKLIEIVKKYGIAGASAMLGMDVLANMDEAQASQLKKAENMGNIQKSLLSGGW